MNEEYTFGMEFEFPDVDKNIELLHGFTWDWNDGNVVNSDGTATDPTGKISKIGGEYNTSVFTDIDKFANAIRDNFALFPELSINHRSHPHIHVGHPALDTLEGYKKFVKYAYDNHNEGYARMWFDHEKKPDKTHPATKEKLFARPKMPAHVYNRIMEADSMEACKKAHGQNITGKFSGLWIKRYGWNTYSYFKENRKTVEIRTIRPTLDVDQIHEQLLLCKTIVHEALNDQTPFVDIWNSKEWNIPFGMPDFDPFLEYGWDLTNARKNKFDEIVENRKTLLTREQFDTKYAGGLTDFLG